MHKAKQKLIDRSTVDVNANNFCSKLFKFYIDNDYSTKELAYWFDTTQRTIIDWISGKRKPSYGENALMNYLRLLESRESWMYIREIQKRAQKECIERRFDYERIYV